MRTFNQWMEEYGVSHQNPTNKKIHHICVPVIMFSVIGLFWCIPTPAFMQTVPYMNWATLFVLGCLMFYLSLNRLMFFGLAIQTVLMLFVAEQFYYEGILLELSIGLFIIAWIVQFIGHKIEGKKPSFLQDLAFLLVGPMWVQRALFSKFGIKV
jgi:uncharacterized membrane protein YGL010W